MFPDIEYSHNEEEEEREKIFHISTVTDVQQINDLLIFYGVEKITMKEVLTDLNIMISSIYFVIISSLCFFLFLMILDIAILLYFEKHILNIFLFILDVNTTKCILKAE
ncbi:hypothetical protein MAR_000662 [Mya arenaria]|uniref:Uncharacterized protein n=1 Tax=Mya arenaria TaxID=6604 RepID=A0ABY7FBS4_MYAAR|nr:hypothetical protein MAR_000662 [Mya arenaria]